jgi:hypothetical protein
MKNDRGAAALAALLHDTYGCRITCRGGRLADDRHPSHTEAYLDTAERLLGERGRFLPDGDCGHTGSMYDRMDAYRAENERLRTALAECSLIVGATTFGPGDSPEVSLREVVRIARAALSPEPKP